MLSLPCSPDTAEDLGQAVREVIHEASLSRLLLPNNHTSPWLNPAQVVVFLIIGGMFAEFGSQRSGSGHHTHFVQSRMNSSGDVMVKFSAASMPKSQLLMDQDVCGVNTTSLYI